MVNETYEIKSKNKKVRCSGADLLPSSAVLRSGNDCGCFKKEKHLTHNLYETKPQSLFNHNQSAFLA